MRIPSFHVLPLLHHKVYELGHLLTRKDTSSKLGVQDSLDCPETVVVVVLHTDDQVPHDLLPFRYAVIQHNCRVIRLDLEAVLVY